MREDKGAPEEGEEGKKGQAMTVASVTEISAVSLDDFDEAIREGIDRATSTLRGVARAWGPYARGQAST